MFPHPVQYRLRVQQCFRSGKCLGRYNEQGFVGGKTLQHRLQSGTIDVRYDLEFIFFISDTERPMQHLGSKRRATNAEMNDLREFT